MKGSHPRVDLGLLILRIGIGGILLIYGCQKMFGIFGGHGYSATITGFTSMGIPAVLAHLSIAAEFFGSLGILFGLLTPVAALGVAANMAVATYFNARKVGFEAVFVSGDPVQSARILYPLALFFMALAVLLLGAGRYSLDAKLFKRGR